MGTDVSWRTDDMEVVGAPIYDPHMVLSRLIRQGAAASTVQLRYVDIYGTAVFNYLQVPELVDDLRDLLSGGKLDADEVAHLARIVELADAPNPDRFLLVFFGD